MKLLEHLPRPGDLVHPFDVRSCETNKSKVGVVLAVMCPTDKIPIFQWVVGWVSNSFKVTIEPDHRIIQV